MMRQALNILLQNIFKKLKKKRNKYVRITTYWYVKSLHNNKLQNHKTLGVKARGPLRRPFKIKM